MHQLVPSFILDRYAAEEFQGDFEAASLFLDISGFSSMTNALMAHGQHGAEVLAEIMRSVLDPLITSVYEQGGFVASSAGDAITALFPVHGNSAEACLRALAAAHAMQERMRARPHYATPYQVFSIFAKVGLAIGQVHWGIIFSEQYERGIYYFQGTAVDGCAESEHHAKAGDVILDSGFLEQVKPQVETTPTEAYFRVNSIRAEELPGAMPIQPQMPALSLMSCFYPEELLTQELTGEFRQVVNMFISLPSVRTETQLRIFIENLFALQDRYGGLLDGLDFGDKGTNLLLFWGAPVTYENDIERALRFILDLQALTSIPISAGLTYQIAHAGFIGGKLHEEYTCSGRGVNLAARFMTAAPRGEIWLDEAIAERVKDQFEIEYIEEMTFKGFALPQKVYAVLARREEVKSLYQGQLVGREHDQEKISAFFQPLFEGKLAGMLLVSGEPGIGKSRLVHEALQALQVEDGKNIQVFLGQTDEILRQSFNPLVYWLRRFLGVSNSRTEAHNKRSFNKKLDELIAGISHAERLANELDRTRSFLGALLGLRWQDSLYEQLDAQGRYNNTLIALTCLLQAESLRSPTILVLEDIHWLDNDSTAFLTSFLRILASEPEARYPIGIIATSREQALRGAWDSGRFQNLHLQGLDRAALTTLAASLLNGPVAEPLLDMLAERAEGNPFYVEQFLHYLKDEGLFFQDQGAWKIQPGGVEALPVDVNVLLLTRLDHLTQQVKEAVQTAAVIGREFEVKLLAYMLHRRSEMDLPEITAAERAAIWSALSEIRYIFNHALLREAAYQMQIVSRRKALHALAFEAYERLYAGELSEYYGELAYHAEQAGMDDAARRYLNLAGEAAKEAYQNTLAVDYYSRALALTPENEIEERYTLLTGREWVYTLQGNQTGRQHDLAELETLLASSRDAAKKVNLFLRKAIYAADTGEYTEAVVIAEQAVRMAEEAGLRNEASNAYRSLALSLRRQGKFDQAVIQAEKSVMAAREAGTTDKAEASLEESRGLNTLGLIILEQGNLQLAAQYFTLSLDIAQSLGKLLVMSTALNNLGILYSNLGNFVEARSYLEQSLEIARKTGDRAGEGAALGNLGFIMSLLGSYQKARAYLEQELRIGREINDFILVINALLNLSSCAGYQGEDEFAEAYARQALEVAQKTGDRSGEGWAWTYLGHHLLAAQKYDAASAAYTQAVAIRQELGQPALAAEPYAGLARAAQRQGNLEAALTHIQPILDLLEAGGNLDTTDEPLRVFLIISEILQQAGDHRAAGMLETAYQKLQERTAIITEERDREAFLRTIAHHREILSAWEQAHRE